MKYLCLSLLLLCGCPPSTTSSAPTAVSAETSVLTSSQHGYLVDYIDIYMKSGTTMTADWINRHPKARIVSMAPVSESYFVVVYQNEK